MYNFGFLLGLTYIVQLVTGLLLTTRYNTNEAFLSVISLRESQNGLLLRYMHANGASFVFITMYLHILRGMYGSNLYQPNTWLSGIVIYALTIISAFLGYVLPWGQMSYWGATVITNLLDMVPGLVNWVIGGYQAANPTLERFLVLHYAIPFIAMALVIIHIFYLHIQGSSNPLGAEAPSKIPFFPTMLMVDLKCFTTLLVLVLAQTLFGFLELSHPDNSIPVNIMQTPNQIVPEWYFLPLYTVLKVVPGKLIGVLMLAALFLKLVIRTEERSLVRTIPQKQEYAVRSILNGNTFFQCSFVVLGLLGSCLPLPTYIQFGTVYFYLSLFIL
eukprot:GHVT01048476.1.p1 GENE.GHVT01048476.1~~GHVT01048476.1.p1  ORF type:complete len:330 (+),score=-50.86 GHVT01048476.1:498-1487(+)